MTLHRRTFSSVCVVGVLLWATLNALSWFAWSRSFGALFIRDPQPPAGIGFPWLVWTSEATAESFLPNVTVLLLDLTVGLAVSVAAGLFALVLSRRGAILTGCAAVPVSPEQRSPRAQYSLRSLLLATTVVAILLGIIQTETDPVRGSLVLICLAGPGMIALSGYLTRRFGDKFSSRAALGLTVLLMIAACVLGEMLYSLADFTRALLAIFVCWTPQFVLIALALKAIEFCWTKR